MFWDIWKDLISCTKSRNCLCIECSPRFNMFPQDPPLVTLSETWILSPLGLPLAPVSDRVGRVGRVGISNWNRNRLRCLQSGPKWRSLDMGLAFVWWSKGGEQLFGTWILWRIFWRINERWWSLQCIERGFRWLPSKWVSGNLLWWNQTCSLGSSAGRLVSLQIPNCLEQHTS